MSCKFVGGKWFLQDSFVFKFMLEKWNKSWRHGELAEWIWISRWFHSCYVTITKQQPVNHLLTTASFQVWLII
jgi:hypothetical protein